MTGTLINNFGINIKESEKRLFSYENRDIRKRKQRHILQNGKKYLLVKQLIES